MDALDLLSSDNYITYNKTIAQNYGIEVAILLGAMCGYQRGFKNKEFFRTEEEIMTDTCLTLYSLRKAKQVLQDNNFLKVTKKGMPAQHWFYVNANKILTTSGIENITTSNNEINTTSDLENATTNKNNNKNNKENNKLKENEELFASFSKEMQTAITKWIIYKKEKHNSYKPTGLNELLKSLQKKINESGENYVIDGISNSMTANYAGIFYNTNNKSQKPQQKTTANFTEREYSNGELKSIFANVPNIEDYDL